MSSNAPDENGLTAVWSMGGSSSARLMKGRIDATGARDNEHEALKRRITRSGSVR